LAIAGLHRHAASADNGGVGLICLLGALIMWKFQLDDSSPWTYVVVVQLVIAGTVIILLGYDWFLRV
jgi:hypothetical protein